MADRDPTATAGSISYYLDDFNDEVVPCDCTLEGWAAWLAKPDEDWGRKEAAADRSTFRASTLRWAEDLVATRQEDGSFRFDREIADEPACIAIRYGPGCGWDPDNIFGSIEDLRAALNGEDDMFKPADAFFDDVEHIAIGYSGPDVVLLYLADPARVIVPGAVTPPGAPPSTQEPAPPVTPPGSDRPSETQS